jgi:hypothetical protein
MVKARVQKRLYYKIGEACKALGIQPYVLRYWETEFPALAPSKSRSGQRVYSEKELETIRRIKELLYDEGGSVGGEPGDEETAAPAMEEAPAPPATPAKTSRARKETAPVVVEAGAEPSLPFALDTGAAERIQTLRSGIEQALQEAREILALLESKSSP